MKLKACRGDWEKDVARLSLLNLFQDFVLYLSLRLPLGYVVRASQVIFSDQGLFNAII